MLKNSIPGCADAIRNIDPEPKPTATVQEQSLHSDSPRPTSKYTYHGFIDVQGAKGHRPPARISLHVRVLYLEPLVCAYIVVSKTFVSWRWSSLAVKITRCRFHHHPPRTNYVLSRKILPVVRPRQNLGWISRVPNVAHET